MLAGCGIDVVEIERFRAELARDPGLRRTLFTEREIVDCERRTRPGRAFATCFAAKEAFLKAAGTGAPDTAIWREIELVWPDDDEPRLVLQGVAAAAARARAGRRTRVSLARTARLAVAIVTLET